ncbi:MAG: (2Fe-2S)-binding protein [Acidobacteria bacterium]|nr:MAG: (2Fe-2S)-binding protein [Acidobacteriota bacterium]
MERTFHFQLNGRSTVLTVEPDRQLLWVLRTDLALTGTKYGCGESHCGACTVLVNEKPVRSCQTPIRAVDGKEVVTIEGLARGDTLHPLQQAFVDNDALQCGYCTPGMILGAYGLLLATPNPTLDEIVAHMDSHLCRCAGYRRILAAIESASQIMGESGS